MEFGDISHAETMEAMVTLTIDGGAPLEEMLMTVLNITANDGEYEESFPMHHIIGAIMEDYESGDFDTYDWGFSSTPWVISPVNVFEGQWSAKSGNIGNGQSSGLTISMEVIGYDDISFYRKVSSEEGFDFLNFYIDGNLVDQWSGEQDWEKVMYDVSPGEHTFKWAFEKDGGVSHGFDAGWIDNVMFPSFNIHNEFNVIANATPYGYCDVGESQLGAYLVGETGNSTFAWTPEANLTGANSQFPVASPEETTIYSVEVDNNGNIATADIQVTVFGMPAPPQVEQQGDSLISSYIEGNQWYDSDGMIEGATAQVFYPEKEDLYFAIHTSEHGCTSDTSNMVQFLWTGLEEVTMEEIFMVFPNPVKENLSIVFERQGTYTVRISDLTGRTMLFKEASGEELLQVETGNWPQGVYLLNVRDDAGRSRVKKIVR
jgi:hypothetical protein